VNSVTTSPMCRINGVFLPMMMTAVALGVLLLEGGVLVADLFKRLWHVSSQRISHMRKVIPMDSRHVARHRQEIPRHWLRIPDAVRKRPAQLCSVDVFVQAWLETPWNMRATRLILERPVYVSVQL